MRDVSQKIISSHTRVFIPKSEMQSHIHGDIQTRVIFLSKSQIPNHTHIILKSHVLLCHTYKENTSKTCIKNTTKTHFQVLQFFFFFRTQKHKSAPCRRKHFSVFGDKFCTKFRTLRVNLWRVLAEEELEDGAVGGTLKPS